MDGKLKLRDFGVASDNQICRPARIVDAGHGMTFSQGTKRPERPCTHGSHLLRPSYVDVNCLRIRAEWQSLCREVETLGKTVDYSPRRGIGYLRLLAPSATSTHFHRGSRARASRADRLTACYISMTSAISTEPPPASRGQPVAMAAAPS